MNALPIPGRDCDIALSHAAVQAGEPVGFVLLRRASDDYGPAVRVHVESYTSALGEAQDVRHLWFTVLLAQDALNPDGSPPARTPAELRALLMEIVLQHRDIILHTPAGLITGLAAGGQVMIHHLRPQVETVEVHLTTRLNHFAPLDPARFAASLWQDAAYCGEMHWDNSYWR